MTALRVGQHVEVPARRGVVRGVWADGFSVAHDDGTTNIYAWGVGHEILPPPEPDYVEGDYYISGNGVGVLYKRWSHRRWLKVESGRLVEHDQPIRPMVHLIREDYKKNA